ncbi:MAG: hypothetical protein WC856_02665 [Methylococcaceae bacterium]|jgi:hypothetical protein
MMGAIGDIALLCVTKLLFPIIGVIAITIVIGSELFVKYVTKPVSK